MCWREVYKTPSEDDSQSRTDLLLCTSLHLSWTLSTTQCALSRTPTHSCTIIYFGVRCTSYCFVTHWHCCQQHHSVYFRTSCICCSQSTSDSDDVITRVSPPLKKINPKCHAHRLPVSIFEIGNRNFVGFHLLCRTDAGWTLVVLTRHGAKCLDFGTRCICCYKYRLHLISLNNFNPIP